MTEKHVRSFCPAAHCHKLKVKMNTARKRTLTTVKVLDYIYYLKICWPNQNFKDCIAHYVNG